MLLIPVVHLDLRISPRIFEQMEYSGAGGKLIHEKNQKQKSRVPLNANQSNANFSQILLSNAGCRGIKMRIASFPFILLLYCCQLIPPTTCQLITVKKTANSSLQVSGLAKKPLY
jgi:hypothetical protein